MLKNNKDWKQQAIALADTGTMSWREIARVLGKSKSTVSDWLRVHKEKELQKFYEEQKPFNEALNNSRENFFEVVEHKDLKSRLTNPKPEKKQIPFKIVTDSTKTTGTHLYIPDCQVKPNVDLEYLEWIGKYIVRKKPDVIVNAGDFADMESLSSYDKGKRSAEGKRVRADIDSAIEGMKLLLAPLHELQMKELQEFGEIRYKPRLVLTLGNHEDRINRYVNDTPSLHGFLSTDDLMYKEFGWEVVDFLTPIEIGGIYYCHYFQNVMTGKPLAGTAANMLTKIGKSFTMGHRQQLDIATRFLQVDGEQQFGLIAGACYLHEEDYKGVQGNRHWKGIVVKHRVNNGSYDPLFVSLDWLKDEYGKD